MKRWIILGLVVGLLVVAYLVVNHQSATVVSARLVVPTNSLPNYHTDELTDYARDDRPRQLTFPADHGPHDDFQTEWW